ncbi:MAG: helix-turn-helix transcriptional regulator [Acidobacteria bacterium]|nr:helix-turn-helix transcriptional regulator [Acidobacteriota bacterium]
MKPVTISAQPGLSAPPEPFYGMTRERWRLTGITFSESSYPSGLTMARHDHNHPYCSFVLAGAYTETVGSKTRSVESHHITFHPREEAHAVGFGNHPTRIFRVEFNTDWLVELVGNHRTLHLPLHLRNEPFKRHRVALYREFSRQDRWSALAVEGIVLELIAELGRLLETRSSPCRQPLWIQQIREQLEAEFLTPPSLTQLAQSVNIHPVTVAKTFRSVFHVTMSEFIRQQRIEFACDQLLQSQLPINQIALESGFYDQSHFTNAFKRVMGVTPAEYRTINQKTVDL